MMARQNLQQASLLLPLAKSILPITDYICCMAVCVCACYVSVYLSMHASFDCLVCVPMWGFFSCSALAPQQSFAILYVSIEECQWPTIMHSCVQQSTLLSSLQQKNVVFLFIIYFMMDEMSTYGP